MTADRSADYLAHILEAAELARSYVDGLSKEQFLEDRRTQQAVIMNIVIIGEAATKLGTDYPDFIEKHPELPWKSMRGMRNRIAHGYFDINLDIVWDTVFLALPQLTEQVRSICDARVRDGSRN
jgi:uncharacterized protein with HEPN domain